jgi:hypothetical protein
MDFDKAVAAFQRKMKGQDLATVKREQYRAMIKDYTSLKYAPAVNGERREREITQEMTDKRDEDRKAADLDVLTDSLIGFVDIELPPAQPRKGNRK